MMTRAAVRIGVPAVFMLFALAAAFADPAVAVPTGGELGGYGFVGDGASHPLSGLSTWNGRPVKGWNLQQWKQAVPQVTSLDNEVDGVAIQAKINACGTGICAIALPGGSNGRVSTTIESGLADLQVDAPNARLTWTGKVALGWEHGAPATPSKTRLYVRGRLDLEAAGENIGAARAIAVNFGPGSAIDYAVSFHDLDVHNWGTGAITVVNAPRGVDMLNVTVIGPDFRLQPGGGIYIEGNHRGSGFQFSFYNCMVLNYEVGYDFKTNAEGGIEGVTFLSSHAYTGKTFLRFRNSVLDPPKSFYEAPILYIAQSDWQGIGPALDIEGATDIRSDQNFWVFEGVAAGRPAPDPLYGFDLKQSHDIVMNQDNVVVLQGVRNMTLFHTDPGVFNVQFNSPLITWVGLAGPQDHGTVYRFEAQSKRFRHPQSIVETGTRFEQIPAARLTYVEDVGGDQVSSTRDYIASAASPISDGTVSRGSQNEIIYENAFVGTTDASGSLKVEFPPTLFRSIRAIAAENGDVDVSRSVCSAVHSSAPSLSNFVVHCPGAANTSHIRINYRIIGK